MKSSMGRTFHLDLAKLICLACLIPSLSGCIPPFSLQSVPGRHCPKLEHHLPLLPRASFSSDTLIAGREGTWCCSACADCQHVPDRLGADETCAVCDASVWPEQGPKSWESRLSQECGLQCPVSLELMITYCDRACLRMNLTLCF